MRKLFFVATSTIVLSCTQETSSIQMQYYDLATFVNEQIKVLSSQKPMVEKTLILNNETELLSTKDVAWDKELGSFLEADLNKQAYQQSYNAIQTDSTIIYTLKNGENLPVKSLKIWKSDKNLRKVEAEIATKNYLFESDKKISLEAENNRLKNYVLDVSQQLFVGKKKHFRVTGKLQ